MTSQVDLEFRSFELSPDTPEEFTGRLAEKLILEQVHDAKENVPV